MTAVEHAREPGLDEAVAPPAAAPGRARWVPEPWRGHRWAHRLALALGLGALYAAGALLPFWFLTTPASGVAFFPAAGLTLATLLLTPRRTWPLWLTAVALAEVAVDLTHHQTVPMAIGFAVANVVEPLVGATALQATLARPRSLRMAFVLYMLCAVTIGPAVGGAIGGAVATWWGSGDAWAPIALRWWLGDAIGVLVVATPILAWLHPPRAAPRQRPFELALITALAMVMVLVPALAWEHPLVYAVLPVLMWGAVRGGVRTVSVAGLGVAFAVDWAAVTGRADELVADGAPGNQLVQVQLFLAVTLLAALLLAVEVVERRRAEADLLAAEQDRHRLERTAILAAAAERRRMAADIHDVVSHALNVVLLQAGAARRSVATDPSTTRELLESIEATGRAAFAELDFALGLVDRTPSGGATYGLSAVPELVETLRKAGAVVDLVGGGDLGGLPTVVDRSAYRVVQESLTNSAKHAPGARTVIGLERQPDCLVVTVVDDGPGPRRQRPPAEGGRGLIGLRERVALLGGVLETGPGPGRGFRVQATFPLLDGAR